MSELWVACHNRFKSRRRSLVLADNNLLDIGRAFESPRPLEASLLARLCADGLTEDGLTEDTLV